MGKHRKATQDGGVSRRQLLGMGAAAAGAVAVGAVVGETTTATATPPSGPTYPVAPAGTTLAKTLLHGTPGAKGYRKVVDGPGEPSLLRADLIGDASRGTGTRTPLVALAQLTDMHIIDAQSPARVEFLDRLDDPGSPGASSLPFQSSYRPQEMLTAHVGEAMVQAINAVTASAPVTGRPLDFAISTGDNADNTQYNEVRWQIDLLDGRQSIRPDSGNLTKWEGIGGPDDRDVAYWHPNGTPLLGKIDNYRGTWGFPTAPGLLDRCRAPFHATGLNVPWYNCFGNHDGLVQGNIPDAGGVLDPIATGSVKITGLPKDYDVNAIVAAFEAGDAKTFLSLIRGGPVKLIKADRNRRLLTRRQTVAENFNTLATPGPVGHGYTQDNLNNSTAYYTFDPVPGVHCISMDTCDQYGYDDGSLDPTQFQWLQAQLKANSSRYLDSNGNWVTGNGPDKLIVIFSHHTVATMENIIGVGRVTGDKVAALFLQFPNVVLWVNGHTHRNTVTAHSRPLTVAGGGGFWEVNTASHVDWPEQARIVELVDNGDGTLSVFGTLIDHAAAESWPATPTTPLELAALSRELGINDPQRDPETSSVDGKRGAISDRNVELLVKAPFAVSG